MRRVLVVEDDPIIAFDLESELRNAGFAVLGPALKAGDALRLIASGRPDAAVVDVGLGTESAEPVAAELQRHGVPFIVVSGYASEHHPPAFSGRPSLVKPFAIEMLLSEVRAMLSNGGDAVPACMEGSGATA